MNILASKRYQRVTNLALAALLVVSTITASVPFLFSETAGAVNDKDSTITAAATCNDQGNVVVTIAGRNNGNGPLTAIVKVGSETNPIATSPATTVPYPEENVRIAVPTNLTSIAAGSAFADVWVTSDTSAPAPYSYEGTYDALECVAPVAINSTTNVSYTTLQEAFNTAQYGQTIKLLSDIEINSTAAVIKVAGTIFDGQNHTLYTINARNSNDQKNAALIVEKDDVTVKNVKLAGTASASSSHGLIVYNARNVTLNNIVARNNAAGIVVNTSTVNASSITTEGNNWYGINVDKGAAVLNISGSNSHTESVAIFVDNNTFATVNDVDHKYTKTVTGLVQAYSLDTTAPSKPVLALPSNGSTLSTNDFNFNWNDSTDANAVTYEFRSSQDPTSQNGNLTGSNIWNSGTLTSSELHSTGAPDGYWFYQVRAKDQAGNYSPWSDIWSVVLDTNKPTLSFAKPTASIYGANDTITVNALDAIALEKVGFEITGTGKYAVLNVAPYTGTATLTRTVGSFNLADGTYNLKANAIDRAGNYGIVQNYSIIVDQTKPVVTSITGATEGEFKNVPVTPRVYVADASATTYTYKIERNGQIAHSGSGSFAAGSNTAQLNKVASEGVYKITFVIKDAANNETTVVRNFTIDTTIPVATIQFPVVGVAGTSFKVQFSEAVRKADAENAANYFLNNWPGAGGSGDLAGDAVVSYDEATRIATVSFVSSAWYVSGEQQWGVRNVRDLAGNSIATTTAYSSALVAPSKPGVPVTSTPTRSLTNVWTWTAANDEGTNPSGVKGYEYALAESEATPTSWTYTTQLTATTTVAAQGEYTLHVRALDNAGNTGEAAKGKVVIDTDAPAVTLTASSTAVGNGRTVTLTGSVDNAPNYTLTLNGNPVPFNGTSYAFNTTGLVSGNYVFVLTATDAASNSADETVTITVDNTDPEVAITAPVIAETGNITSFDITGTTGDATRYDLYVNDVKVVDQQPTTGEIEYTQAASAGVNSTYLIRLVAFDQYGNSSEDATELTVDNAAPALTVSPVTDQTGTPTVTGTAEAGSVLTVTFNGQTTTIANDNGNYTFTSPTALANGDYTFLITATDAAGNATNRSAVVTVAVPASATTATPAAVQTFSVAPTIVSPSAVLGVTDTANNDGAAEVKGTTTDNFAAIDVNNNDGKIFGLAWFWWILILAAIAAAAWWIIGAARRRNENNA